MPMSALKLCRKVVVIATYAALPFSIACGLSPADASGHLAAGNKHFEAGRTRDAIIEYRNATQADPKLGEARAKLAAAYEKIGDGGKALEEFIRAADLLPNDISIQLTAGRYLLAARKVPEALARADAALALQPENVEAHVLRGNALGGLNELDKALTEMEEALRLDPSRGVTYTQLGLVEAARGRAGEAENAFKQAIELAPKEVGGHLALANFYWSSGRLADAEEALQDALALDPNNESTNRALAVFTLASGRVEQAEGYLKRISDLNKAPASIFALADYYVATRRSSRAIELLEPLAEQRTTGAKQRLASAYAAAGNSVKAHALIDELLKTNPRDASTLLLKVQLLFDEGKREEALPLARAAAEAEPTSIAAQFMLGRIYQARGDRDGARSAYREVLKLNPSATAAQIELATIELAADKGKTASATQALEKIAADPNAGIDAKVAIVRGLLSAQEFDRADREIRQLLQQAPNVAAVHVQAGVLAASRNDSGAARASFDRALSIDPESVEAVAGLVALDLNRKDFAAAKQRIDRRLESATSPSPAILLLAARTYATVNDLAAAEKMARRIIETDATVLPAYDVLARIYVKQNRLDDAQREFDRLAQRQSAPAPSLTMSGLLLEMSGKTAEARKRYEQAVAADDRAVVAANNLAWLYADAGEQLSEALRLARGAAEIAPANPSVLDTLGWVYLKNSLPALAVAPLARAASIDPKHAGYQYRLGLAYMRSGDGERGRAALNRALELDSAAPWAADARQALAAARSTTSR